MSDVVRHELENMVVRKERQIEDIEREEKLHHDDAQALLIGRATLEQEVAEINQHLEFLTGPVTVEFPEATGPPDAVPFYEKDTSETVPFTEEAIMGYLDDAIRSWRQKRDGRTRSRFEADQSQMASHYVDAYQSMRTSLFGDILE